MIKRLLSSALTLALVLGSVATLVGGLPAQAATMNTYIKGSGPTVYWYASNGRRYVFPNGQTFQSWQTASSPAVATIGDVELYTIPIGGNMTYRPGSRLVKITTDPKVYAVARYGVLRWVTSETVAQALYGQNWAQMVDDLPDEFFANYTIGAPINSAADYNASNQYNAVVNPGDNISTQASIGNGNGSQSDQVVPGMWVAMTASREVVPAADSNREVMVTATLMYPSVPVDQLRIRIYDRDPDGSGLGTLLRTCEGSVACSQTAVLPLQTGTYSRRYVGNITNRLTGQLIANDSSFYVQAQGSGNTTQTNPTETVLPYGPYTCIPGYVWREAIPDDYVCVTPDVRAQGWADNAQAAARVSQTDHTYGPDTCIMGYVWRGITSTDHVCVLSRDQMLYDNSQAMARRVSSRGPTAMNPNGSIVLSLDRSTINSTQSDRTATFSASVSNLQFFPVDQVRIRFVNENTETVSQSCDGVLTCTFSYTVGLNTPSMTVRYRAELFNRATNVMVATPSRKTLTVVASQQTTPPVMNDGRLDVDHTTIMSGQMTALAFTAPSGIATDHVYVEFFKDNMVPMVWSCAGVRTCNGSAANWSNGYPTTRYRAVVYDRAPGQSGQGTYVTTIYSPVITFTSYDVCPSTICTYAITPGPLAPVNNPAPAFQVTSVSSALDQAQPNRCNEGFGVIGTITANGPGTVSYKWERSDGALPPTQTVTFAQAGTKTVTGSWFLSGTYSGWLQLHVIAPNEMNSNQTAIVSQCPVVQPAFQVTSVSSALDQSKANRCNEGFGVIGTINTNGAGTVQYQWERSDGAIAPIKSVTFAQAGTQTVSETWSLSGDYAGWMRLKIISPTVDLRSNQTAMVSQCVAPTPTPAPTPSPTLSGSIYTSTDPGVARAGSMVRVDANLSLQNSNGPVRVEIYNQDGQGIKTCWNMSTSGFCQAYQAMIPATAQGTYQFYSQAIDGSGAVLRSNWFPVRIQ